jgi:hypothetical protein
MSILYENALNDEPCYDTSYDLNQITRPLDKISKSIKELQNLGKYTDDDDSATNIASIASEYGDDIDYELDSVHIGLTKNDEHISKIEEQLDYWKQNCKNFSSLFDACLVDDLKYTQVVMNGWMPEWNTWLHNNIIGKWTLASEGSVSIYYFENDKDATFFKISNEQK